MSTKAALSRYIQKRNLQTSHSLQNCNLVIDGDSFLKESYKSSDCQFLLGPDCNSYANYLHKQLKCFSECNIKCYVIFKGTTRDGLERRQEIHEKIISDRRLGNSSRYPSYFDPLLVKDVQKQVLDLMGIKYFCCEYESIEAIVGVARAFKCPVLTDNLAYCFYGVSCIPPNSVTWKEDNETVECTIYNNDIYKTSIGVHNKMPILLTVLYMIYELPQCGDIDDIGSVIHWVKHQKNDVIVHLADTIDDADKSKELLGLYKRTKVLYLYPSCNLAVKYFQREKSYGLYKDDKRWFSKGVSNGRIAISYVDMKREGLVIGCTVVNDMQEPDAIKAATQIITYAHCLLTNSQESNLTYIVRDSNGDRLPICTMWKADNCWKQEICNRDIFNKYGKMKKKPSIGNPFRLFIKEVLHECMASELVSLSLPGSSRILVVTLVYYVHKVNKKFIDCAYSILLCYVILNNVTEKIREGEPPLSNQFLNDSQQMYDKLKFLFKYDDLKVKYDSSILHSLAEFLHCLQHMNYLNNLCGQGLNYTDFPSTVYHKTYNATFVYNAFTFMKTKKNLMDYLDSNFKDSWCLRKYKSIVSIFDDYLQCLQNGKD